MATKNPAKPIAGDKSARQINAEAKAKNEAKREGEPKAEPKTKKAAKPAPSAAEPLKLTIKLDASKADVEKLITSIKTRGAKLDIDIHSAGCASLNHAALHNDPTLLNRLLLAMPKATRRNALTAWAMKHGNVQLNTGPSAAEFPLVYDKSKTANIEAAQAEPFWALKNVREGGNEWLYVDYISNVMKTLARVATDPKSPESAKAKAALDAITAVNEALNTKAENGPAPTWTPGMPERRGDRTEAAAPADAAVH